MQSERSTFQNSATTDAQNKSEVDYVWKNFTCPKYISHLCPKTSILSEKFFEFDERLKLGTHEILQKLDLLISDPVTSDSVIRICRLLYDYLHEVGADGYKIKDLPLVMKVLKFLAENVENVKEYELHLDRMLEICRLPPVLEKFSDGYTNCDIVEKYFTLLGDLLVILPKEQSLKVNKSLHSLLLRTKEARSVNAMKLEHLRKAMEKSMLPVTVVQILQSSSIEMYSKRLGLVLLFSSISDTCSRRMLETDALNTILTRMDLPYATQSRCTRPPDLILAGNDYCDKSVFLIVNTLWSLLKYIVFSNDTLTHLKESTTPHHCVLWGLCYAFKKYIWNSQYRNFYVRIRNDTAVIILMILVSFPKWNLVSCGIAEAVIKYFIGVESGSARVFSETIPFPRTIDNLQFEKTLLLIVTHLAEDDACIFLMVNRKLMNAILDIVNPSTVDTQITWNASQFWDLWTHALNALAVLAPKMPQQFTESDGCIRLYLLLEWCLNNKFDEKIMLSCTKAICTIVLSENAHLLGCFREYGIILLLIKFAMAIVNRDRITMKLQRILTLTLVSAERLMRKQEFFHEIYAECSVLFVMQLLFRCVYQKDEELQIDQRLLIALGGYIWECITWCPRSLKKFIHYGGLYVILDIIEIVPYYSRCLYLGILTDMCDNYHCSPFLCTWRGINEKRFMSLLAMIWREEEIRVKVLSSEDGTDNDTELLQMSRQQWLDTYHIKLATGSSPTLIDVVGSVRPKIYSISKLIERDSGRFDMAKERYKILHTNLSAEDRITVSMIQLYFRLKLGQMWVEVAKYMEQIGITPLGMDGQALFLMMQRYHLWASLTKEKRVKIMDSVKLEEEIKEKDEYAKIRDSKLVSALDAFDELDYIYRTTDRSYLLRKKYEQVQQVNASLNFPPDTCDTHCHRTFQENVTFTTIFNQHQTIIIDLGSESYISQRKEKLPPVSPTDSKISFDSVGTELSLGTVTETCLPLIERFDENEL